MMKDAFYFVYGMLTRHYGYSAAELVSLLILFKTMHLQKGYSVIKEGQACNMLGLLINGTLICERVDTNGETVVTRIVHEDGSRLVSDYKSFILRKPSEEKITAVENSRVQVISYDDFQEKAMKFPQADKIMTHLTQEILFEIEERNYELQTMNGKQRVQRFMERYSRLYNILTREQLASYLHINRNDLTIFVKQYYLEKK